MSRIAGIGVRFSGAVLSLHLLRRAGDGGRRRPVIGELRPSTTDLWQGMPLPGRARFPRHIRP